MYPYFWDKCPIDISMEISNYLKYKHNLKKIDNLDFTIRFSIIHALICAVCDIPDHCVINGFKM